MINQLYTLVCNTEDYRSGCIKSYDCLDLTGMLENFYLWVLAHTARDPETFNCRPEAWWKAKADLMFDLLMECKFTERLDELKRCVQELQSSGIEMDGFLDIFPNLEWDMVFLTEDCHPLAVEIIRFNQEYTPDKRRLVLGKAILFPIREQMEEFAFIQTPLTYVYWWAAWFYSDKEDCLKQIWWDSVKECMKKENITETLDKISKLTAKKNGRYIYGLERSIYEDGKTFPYPEYPLDLAKRTINLFK